MYGFAESSESLVAQLTSPETEQDVSKTRAVLRKVLQLAPRSDGSERVLVPHVIKLLASPDMVVKKLAVWCIMRNADTDSVLLAVNSLIKDCSDANPMVRGLALRTLSSFPQTDLASYAVDPALKALHNSSAYMRRVAVVACAKLHALSPELLAGRGVVNTLYGMIRDPDPLVVDNCLLVLDEMLAAEGGIVVNRNMAQYLLSQLPCCTEWGLTNVLRVLCKYTPAEEEEVLDIMNIADPFLHHHNTTVVLTCLQYFLHIVAPMPHLRVEVLRRARPQLLASLRTGNPELCHELLVFVESLLQEYGAVFQENYAAFFCKYSEPQIVKKRKLRLLPQLVTEGNVEEVLEELELYCTDLNSTLSECAIIAVGEVGTHHPAHQKVCLQRLVALLHMDIDYVTSHALQVLQGLDLGKDETQCATVLQLLPQCLPLVNDCGRAALWCLLGNYGQMFDETPYMLEAAVSKVKSERSRDVRLQLMNACMKMFFRRPAQMQHTLGQLLYTLGSGEEHNTRGSGGEHDTRGSGGEHDQQVSGGEYNTPVSDEDCDVLRPGVDHDTRDRARWYYKLLKTDVALAELIVLGT